MAEESNKDEMNAIGSASFSSAMVKESFFAWLSDGNAKKYSPGVYLSCIDKVSAYLIRRKISLVDLWQLTTVELYKSVYDKAVNDKLFRATNKKTYDTFVQVGQTFLKFLKSKPPIHKDLVGAPEPPSRSGFCLTLKEAVIRALETEQHGMTAEQIYEKIIADGLYSFSERNPQNVVRVELNSACVSSNYIVRASKDCFRFERNKKGEKVYFLLSATPTNKTIQPSVVINSEPTDPGEAKNEPSNIEFWNDSIERNFQIWMESEDYTPAATRNYCSAVNRTVQNFRPLVDAAVTESSTELEAVCKFIVLLHQNSGFIAANSKAHYQLSVTLGTLARFVDSDTALSAATADSEVKSITTSSIDESVKSAVASILVEHFPNGIRPNSIIDINKLKSYYHKATGGGIISADIIPSLLNAISIRHGEKVFAVPSSGKKALVELVDRLIFEGNRLFFYDEFFDTHVDFLQAMNVFSAELLKTVLSNILPSLSYSRSYFSIEGNVTVKSEVLRCYETAVCLSYEQLKAKLPYVPLDKVKQVLSQNSDFIWVNTEVYTHVSKIEIDGSERHTAEDKVKTELAERGYASLALLDVSASLELNPDLSEIAVKKGLFQIYFADCYEKRGNIITQKGTVLNAVNVFKDYCLTHDRLTLDELLELEREINGNVHGQSLFVAYDTMVRVDKNTFVGDSEISFDIETTDNALALFVHADVIPLQAVTSFTSFPYIDGYLWNLYLLESYCKRFSKRFMYQCLSVNSRNVGAIFRRSAGFTDYIDVLAAAVAASNIELKEKVVGDFLFENRYVAQRTGAVSKITAKARILRERKA